MFLHTGDLRGDYATRPAGVNAGDPIESLSIGWKPPPKVETEHAVDAGVELTDDDDVDTLCPDFFRPSSAARSRPTRVGSLQPRMPPRARPWARSRPSRTSAIADSLRTRALRASCRHRGHRWP